jgi:hypothetical protein
MATRCAHLVKWSGCELHRRASFRADGCNTLYDHEVAVEGRAKTIKGTGGAGKEIVLGLLYRETRKVRVARLASREKGTLHEHVSDNVASAADCHSAPALFKHRGGESIEKRQSVLERYQGRLSIGVADALATTPSQFPLRRTPRDRIDEKIDEKRVWASPPRRRVSPSR